MSTGILSNANRHRPVQIKTRYTEFFFVTRSRSNLHQLSAVLLSWLRRVIGPFYAEGSAEKRTIFAAFRRGDYFCGVLTHHRSGRRAPL